MSVKESRARELRIAMLKIAKGRASAPGGPRLSVAAVARACGVSPALLYNHHQVIVEEIRQRAALQKAASEPRSSKQSDTIAKLQAEVKRLKEDVSKLATANELLQIRCEALEASRLVNLSARVRAK